MIIRTATAAQPNENIIIETPSYSFCAIWKGTLPVAVGEVISIELDSSDVLKVEKAGTVSGIINDGPKTRIVGQFLQFTEVEQIILDLQPGILVATCEVELPPLKKYDLVTVFVEQVEAWPTGM